MQQMIDYILSFLLYNHAEARTLVGYTSDQSQWDKYRLIIRPSGNFAQGIVVPDCPTTLRYHHEDECIIIDTDIVYATFIFLSRAEELLVPERDEHGRFLAKHVQWGKDGNTIPPLIDMWSHQLLTLLGLPLPQPTFSAINLTHDVDTIAHYRHLRGFLGGLKRGQFKAALQGLQHLEHDAAYTFPWLVEQDAKLPTAKQIYFVKATHGTGHDYPQYNLQGNDFQHLAEFLQAHNAQIGLHTSYEAGTHPTLVQEEKTRLRNAINQPIKQNRWHFLRTTQPSDFQALIDSGIMHDYSLGFADALVPRLRTFRSTYWLNPHTQRLTSLRLHPLSIMDCTLSNSNYMNLSYADALQTSQSYLSLIHHYSGEANLLWHNNNFHEATYHQQLYPQIIAHLHQLNDRKQ